MPKVAPNPGRVAPNPEKVGALSRKWTLRNGLCLAEALTALRLVWVPS
jgi:hypothetical protein